MAETLSKAKNTSISGMVDVGILASSRGKVRLLKPAELPADWDPTTDPRLTTWEMVHQLIRALEVGETAAAALVAKLGAKAEIARELAYRLYTLCSASAKSVRPRRWRTTDWCRAGPRSRASHGRERRREPNNARCSRKRRNRRRFAR